jgi:hypothetical protein
MIHEADGVANPPWSVAQSSKSTKLVEAPVAYSAPFIHNASDLSRRVFLGMTLLVDESIGNVSAGEKDGRAQLTKTLARPTDKNAPHDPLSAGAAQRIPARRPRRGESPRLGGRVRGELDRARRSCSLG